MKKFIKVVSFFLLLVILVGVSSVTTLAAEQVFPTLAVAGNATIKTVPDIGNVTFSIKTFDYDAKISQEDNKAKSNGIYKELTALEIDMQFIKTQSYTIKPIYESKRVEEQVKVINGDEIEWKTEYKTESIFKGYETLHTIVVTINGVDNDISILGKVIDLSISNGANQTNGVSFVLSDEKREAVYVDALDQASSRAYTKAQTVAENLRITTLRAVTVNIENINVNVSRPAVVPTAPGVSGGGGADAPSDGNAPIPEEIYTPISPGETSISANVSVIFTY